MIQKQKSIYFPSLNGFRFIAAFLVFIFHIEKNKEEYHFNNLMHVYFFQVIGEFGVTMFFCLSGFLISYLLFKEIEITNQVNIKSFYIRRILRIWPLYFLIIAISLLFFYLNGGDYREFIAIKLALYCTFLVNICFLLFTNGGFPSQLWSVASEEQFYVIWPWLLVRNKHRFEKMVCLIVLLFMLLRFLLNNINDYNVTWKSINLLKLLSGYLNYFRVDCMAIGGLFAYFLFIRHKLLDFFYKEFIQFFVLILMVFSLLVKLELGIFRHTFYAILVSVLILNTASNPKSVINLEYIFFNFMGKISYGFYVYHPLILYCISKLVFNFVVIDTITEQLFYFVVCFISTTLISYLSFKYFESPFLKFKHKFEIIKSSDSKS
jgi:peptidoglycan/LPS O-acetylase OafA/YrhL